MTSQDRQPNQLKYDVKPQIITGICKCGHSWEDHHLGMIMNKDYLDALHKIDPKHPPYIAEECEYYGFNECGGLDRNGNHHCHRYEE